MLSSALIRIMSHCGWPCLLHLRTSGKDTTPEINYKVLNRKVCISHYVDAAGADVSHRTPLPLLTPWTFISEECVYTWGSSQPAASCYQMREAVPALPQDHDVNHHSDLPLLWSIRICCELDLKVIHSQRDVLFWWVQLVSVTLGHSLDQRHLHYFMVVLGNLHIIKIYITYIHSGNEIVKISLYCETALIS